MKKLLAACFLILGSPMGWAGEAILPYDAFGPQVASHELIGMAWWQWDPHGDGSDREYPIKVVVFWDQTLEETAKRHPVDREKQRDFRYVKHSKAVDYLERTIKEFEEAEFDTSSMKRVLARLKMLKAG